MKKAFTLVELLVVIAIIGILAGVLMGTFSGGADSAKAARCLSNMRNLGAAVTSYASQHGYFPAAGSYERIKVTRSGGSSKKQYYATDGWISWNSQGAYATDSAGYYPQSHKASASWNTSMYSEDEEERRYALTNGVLYAFMGGNHSAYVCPTHAVKKNRTGGGMGPNFSYVMNAYFKWDDTKGKSAKSSDYSSVGYTNMKRADKRLLFAEIPFMDVEGASPESTTGEECDSILQYKGCLGCGTPETIGFNHKSGKQYSAHVCFADGHVERLAFPKKGLSQAECQELTQWLCEGKEISFDGAKYEEMK